MNDIRECCCCEEDGVVECARCRDARLALEETRAPPTRTALRVVAAAVQLSCGKIIVGVRHYDQLMRPFLPKEPDKGAAQGFVLSDYRFVGRVEALEIAKAANQILPGEGQHGQLYSEDLY